MWLSQKDHPYYLEENLEHIKSLEQGLGFIPKILNRDIYDEILLIDDEDAQMMARRLSAEEGILVGASGAASAYFAVQVAKNLPSSARVLCLAPDTGERYLSSDLFPS